MPYIKLINGNEDLYIWCEMLPEEGETGPLMIGSCRRARDGAHQYLAFNYLKEEDFQGEPLPIPAMEIRLQQQIQLEPPLPNTNLIFALNGGPPWISIKEDH